MLVIVTYISHMSHQLCAYCYFLLLYCSTPMNISVVHASLLHCVCVCVCVCSCVSARLCVCASLSFQACLFICFLSVYFDSPLKHDHLPSGAGACMLARGRNAPGNSNGKRPHEVVDVEGEDAVDVKRIRRRGAGEYMQLDSFPSSSDSVLQPPAPGPHDDAYTKVLELPQICVAGDQSSGKSSLLQVPCMRAHTRART